MQLIEYNERFLAEHPEGYTADKGIKRYVSKKVCCCLCVCCVCVCAECCTHRTCIVRIALVLHISH